MPTNYHSELCTEKNKMKIFEGLSNSKNMVVNVKKLLNVGVSDREVGWCLEPKGNGVNPGRGNVGGPGPLSVEQKSIKLPAESEITAPWSKKRTERSQT